MMLRSSLCGCSSLRTGSIVLAVLWLIADLALVIGHSTGVADKDAEDGGSGHRLGYFIGLCLNLMHLVGDALLLLGADKGKAQWVKFAVINHFVSLVLAAIAILALSIYYGSPALFFAGYIGIAIAGYFWLVIYSFYWQLIEVAMTETQAQVETSSLTKPTEYISGRIEEDKHSSSKIAY